MKDYFIITALLMSTVAILGQFPEQKLVPLDNESGDFFGRYLCIQNNQLIISAHEDDVNGYASGSIYTFDNINNPDEFEEKQKLFPDDGDVEEFFGYSVDIDGPWAITGSHHDSDYGGSSGSAFILKIEENEWALTQKLLPTDPKAGDEFGKAVGIWKKDVAVGSFLDDDKQTNSGSVYIFTDSGSGWFQAEELYSSDPEAYDQFGNFLALRHGWLAVGVPEKKDKGEKSGAVYVFQKTDSNYVEIQKIVPDDLAAGDLFGQALAIDKNTLAIGAYKADNPKTDGGRVYVFKFNNDKWELSQTIIANDNDTGDHFGSSIALDDDILAIGAYFDDDKGSKSGSVYLYKKENDTFKYINKITASDGKAGAAFGASLSLDDSKLLVGAYADTENGFFSGAAYVYDISSSVDVINQQNELQNIKVFPILVDQKVQVLLPEEYLNYSPELFIFDTHGHKISTEKLVEKQTYTDLSHLPKGIYYLIIRSKKGYYSEKLFRK